MYSWMIASTCLVAYWVILIAIRPSCVVYHLQPNPTPPIIANCNCHTIPQVQRLPIIICCTWRAISWHWVQLGHCLSTTNYSSKLHLHFILTGWWQIAAGPLLPCGSFPHSGGQRVGQLRWTRGAGSMHQTGQQTAAESGEFLEDWNSNWTKNNCISVRRTKCWPSRTW